MNASWRLLGLGLLMTAACAHGITDDDPSLEDDSGSMANGSGGFGDGGMGDGGFGDGGMGDGGFGDGGMGMGGMGMGGMPPGCQYDAPNTCPTAQGIPTVAGDESQPPQIRTGNTEMWFEVKIEEQDSSIFETDLSYTVTLQSPAGMDWDLVVRQGPQDGNPNCNATNKTGVPLGNLESVNDSWDDDQGLGGEDDSVWLSIGIFHASGGLCGDDANWTLTVEGHTG